MNKDTIVARATANGLSGISIIRVSGDKAKFIYEMLFPTKKEISPRYARFCYLRHDGQIIDHCISIFFSAPTSATGEDVLEIHTHGNPVLSEIVIKDCIKLGARLAQPGEFTQRAFLNGKIDLVQAEATADLIAAASEIEIKSAAQSLTGQFSKKLDVIQSEINKIRVQVEALIDFSDQDITPSDLENIKTYTQKVVKITRETLSKARLGAKVRQGLTVAIIGPANAGKSSLLNALTQEDTAIVTDIAGTTRDALKERIYLDGLGVTIIDTAGIRDTDDIVEKAGIERTKTITQLANHVLIVLDGNKDEREKAETIIKNYNIASSTVIYNKSDLMKKEALLADEINISAKTGNAIDTLITRLKNISGQFSVESDQFIARERHVELLKTALTHLQESDHAILEVRAHELKLAQLALDQILGVVSADDLLGQIFSTFCVGK